MRLVVLLLASQLLCQTLFHLHLPIPVQPEDAEATPLLVVPLLLAVSPPLPSRLHSHRISNLRGRLRSRYWQRFWARMRQQIETAPPLRLLEGETPLP